jgi:myo-inositol-1(or 4)-monophosphatase
MTATLPRQALYVAEILALSALDRMSRRPTAIETKAGPADFVTDTDRDIETRVRERIAEFFPEHAVVGEEFGGTASPAQPTWFVDPVDGTTNYAHDLPWHSFSLALHDADGPVAAVVADGRGGEILSAARGLGARRDGVPIRASSTTDLAGTVVLTELAAHAPWPGQLAFLERMAERKATVRIMGSSALTLATVATGRVAAAVLGGDYGRWDVAAGALIAQEAGARVFGHDGTEASRSAGPPARGVLIAAPGIAEELHSDLLAAARR